MARRFVASRRPAKKIDFKQWTSIPSGSVDLTVNQTFPGPGLIAFSAPATILRVRGVLRVSFLVTGLTADDEAQCVFGLAVLSSDAVTLGQSAMPDPAGEPEYPWMWYGQLIMYSPNADFGAEGMSVELPVDTKAMRKVKPGESLVMVVQYVDVTGTPGLRLSYNQMRVLLGT